MQAKALIQKLAQRLDDGDKCKKNEISSEIKKILADKIKEHKISVKWIEECLPGEYKRRYRSKCELSSHLKKSENIRKAVEIANNIDKGNGSTLLINRGADHSNSIDNNNENTITDVARSRRFERPVCEISIDRTDPDQILQEENSELREALKRQTAIVTADQILSTEMEFEIPKEKYDEIKDAMTNSQHSRHMIFDKSGVMVRVVPDIFKTN